MIFDIYFINFFFSVTDMQITIYGECVFVYVMIWVYFVSVGECI